MRDGPARGQIMQARKQSEQLLAARHILLPAVEIHRHVDDHEEDQIGGDTHDRQSDRKAGGAAEVIEQPQQGDRYEQEGHRPQRVLERIAEIIRRDHGVPGEGLREQDQRNDHHRDVSRRIRLCQLGELVQHDGPLQDEANLGDGRDRSPDKDARQPGIEQRDPLNVGPWQDGPKGAAEDVGRTQEHQGLDAENPALRTRCHLPVAAMEQHPQGDVGGADDQQKTPPDRNRVRGGQPLEVHMALALVTKPPRDCNNTDIRRGRNKINPGEKSAGGGNSNGPMIDRSARGHSETRCPQRETYPVDATSRRTCEADTCP